MTPEQILHAVASRPDLQNAVRMALINEERMQQAQRAQAPQEHQQEQPAFEQRVGLAMEFIRLVHRSLGPAIIHDEDVLVSRRELHPSEAAAFDAACDLMYDTFGGRPKH